MMKSKMEDIVDEVQWKARQLATDVEILTQTLDEGRQILKEGKEDIIEICTDGFKETVIEGNPNYKTSREKKEEANRIISVQTEKLENECAEVNGIIQDFNEYVETTNNQKSLLAQKYNKYVSSYEKIKGRITSHKAQKPVYSKQNTEFLETAKYMLLPTTIPRINTYKYLGIVPTTGGELAGITLLGEHLSKVARVEAANNYLSEAQRYKNEVTLKSAELKRIKMTIDEAKVILQEEEYIINSLLEDDLESKELNELGQELRTLMTGFILNEDGSLNEKYKMAVDNLNNYIRNI